MNGVEIRTPAHTDLIDLIAQFDTFRVADRLYSHELLIPQLTIRTKDLLSEASTCGAHILYWGIEAARAERHYEQAEAAYRAWRDRMWIEFKTGGDPASKAPSDALCEKKYRTAPEYGEWQRRIADAKEGMRCSQAVLEAFRAKRELIKAQEKLLSDEAGGPYFVVEEQPTKVPRQPQ
jgi:hypothetical protein